MALDTLADTNAELDRWMEQSEKVQIEQIPALKPLQHAPELFTRDLQQRVDPHRFAHGKPGQQQ